MAFELDSIFYTETMVKILQTQGHLQYASRICEEILKKEPSRIHLRDLLDQLKTSSFRNLNISPRIETPVEEDEEETTEPGLEVEALSSSVIEMAHQEVESINRMGLSPREEKLKKLHNLLEKILSKQRAE